MIPRTFPSVFNTTDGSTQMVAYVLPSKAGLTEWVDYIPVKTVSSPDTTQQNTYSSTGYQSFSVLTDTTGKQAWVDYVPVFVESGKTVPWSTDSSGYIPYAATLSDPNFANVSLLLHMDGTNGSTTFTDNSPTPKTVTAYNGASISTSQFKFGGASGFFDGSNDYLETPSNAGFQFGTDDFTVEFFIRFAALSAPRSLVGTYNSSSAGWLVQWNNSGSILRFMRGDTILKTWPWAPSINVWYHVAVTRSGTDLRAFVNGTEIGTTATNSTNFNDATPLTIGRLNLSGGTQYFNGFLDEIRLTKGVARYTANFTPPTVAFPDS